MSSPQEGKAKRRANNKPPSEPSQNSTPTSNNPSPNQQIQDNAQQPQPANFESLIQVIFRIVVIFYLISWLFKGNQQESSPENNSSSKQLVTPDAANGKVTTTRQLLPLWPQNSIMDLRVYLSEEENFSDFHNPSALVWHANQIHLGDWSDEREKAVEIAASVNVQSNGTLYAHIYLTPENAQPNSDHPASQLNKRVYQRKLLTRYFPKRKEIKTKKLIGNQELETSSLESNETKKMPIISYWCQNLTLNIISDNALIPYGQLPPVITKEIPVETTGLRDASGKHGYYLPIVYINDFWILKDHMVPINETTKKLQLNLKYYPISYLKFQMYAQMEESFRKQAEMLGGNAQSEFDEFKRMLLETNPILLAVTVSVSILHSIFEFLAFKNDISDWKNRKEMTGISVRTILMNIFFQLIIFLYLLDNNEETSWMILIGQGVGLAIEIWKIKKAVNIEIKRSQVGILPFTIRFLDKHTLSESEKKTKEYDQLAFRYLSWLAFPLLFGYAIYSLLYDTHKSWYSFVLTTLVGFVYAFGFIMMTPQLFINYKLKSIAHMPWKTLMYKTLGTFVDDLFAFCIKMPTLHRLACLRDDVVFFVYIYQRWIYPVDEKRANEYGQVGEESKKEK